MKVNRLILLLSVIIPILVFSQDYAPIDGEVGRTPNVMFGWKVTNNVYGWNVQGSQDSNTWASIPYLRLTNKPPTVYVAVGFHDPSSNNFYRVQILPFPPTPPSAPTGLTLIQ